MNPLCEQLRFACGPVWQGLHQHPFVVEMARGVLPERKFAFYIGQNIAYLPEFARLMALGVAKAEDEQSMIDFARSSVAVLEMEIPKNRELLARVRELEPSATEDVVMAPANLAYTRHLLTVGYSGRAVDIAAATMPCSWSYGEIGRLYAHALPDHPVYREWIRFFASEEYWTPLEAAGRRFERLCEGLSERDMRRITETFIASTRLEQGFWDMAYNEQQWPDLMAAQAATA